MKRMFVLFALLLLLVCAHPAHGTNFNWITAGSGLFNTGANWSPLGPPNTNLDTAIFDLANTYNVTYQTSVTNQFATVTNGNVTLALSGNVYTVTSSINVGTVAGQTGRLVFSNGNVTGDANIGQGVGTTGFLTIADDAVFDGGAAAIEVGNSGTGTLAITNGGAYVSNGSVLVGNFSQGNGIFTMTGANASLSCNAFSIGVSGAGSATFSGGSSALTGAITVGANNTSTGSFTVAGTGTTLNATSNTLIVGSAGLGEMTVSAGASVTVGSITIALNAGTSGSLVVTGAGTTLTQQSATFNIGLNGMATLEISDGATVNSLAARIALTSGVSSALVTGSGTTWNASSLAVGGGIGLNGGTGTMTIEDGATVNVSSTTEIRNSANSKLTLDGGTLKTGGFTRLGVFNFLDGTLHVNFVFNNGSAPAVLIIDGASTTALPTLRLSNNLAVNNVTSLTVGSVNRGALILDSGRDFDVIGFDIEIAAGPLSGGTISLSGAGTSLFTNGTLSVGGVQANSGGAGVLNVGLGATVSASTLRIWDSEGTAVNLNGGTLTVTTLNTSGNPSRLNWTSGTVNLTSTLSIDINGVPQFGNSLSLGTGKILNNTGPITNNGSILLSGGAMGSLGGSAAIINNSLLSGFGSIGTAAFTNNGAINVSGGSLVVFTSGSGFNNAGTISLESGRSLFIASGLFTNHGSIFLNGGSTTGSILTNAADGVIVGPGSIFQSLINAGTLIASGGGITSVTGSWTNSGIIQLTSTTAQLAGGVFTNNGTIQGFGTVTSSMINNNTIEATGGPGSILNLTGAIANNAAGLITASTGNKILVTAGMPSNNGVINLTGGTFDNNNQPLNNFGQISGFGTFRTGGSGLTNNGSITFTGGFTVINGNVTNTNTRTINIKFNPAIFTGNVTNNAGGTIKTTSTTATFAGTFTNNGTFISDPSTNIFHSDVTNNSTGLMTGDIGDVFNFAGGTVVNQGSFLNGGTLQSSVDIANHGTFTQTGPQLWSNGTKFTNHNGTATFGTNAGSASASPLSITVNNGTVNLGASQNINAITINNGVTHITAGTTKTNTLTFAGAPATPIGQLDLTSNALILQPTDAPAKSAALTDLINQINSGKAGGAWTGQGITSATAAADASHYGVGLFDNAIHTLTTFRGQTVNTNSLITALAHLGDTNFDGIVDIQDLGVIANNWQQSVQTWSRGDLNLDGIVDIQDLGILANNWQLVSVYSLNSEPPAPPEAVTHDSSLNTQHSVAVPEPASLAFLALALPLCRRRRV